MFSRNKLTMKSRIIFLGILFSACLSQDVNPVAMDRMLRPPGKTSASQYEDILKLSQHPMLFYSRSFQQAIQTAGFQAVTSPCWNNTMTTIEDIFASEVYAMRSGYTQPCTFLFFACDLLFPMILDDPSVALGLEAFLT